MTQMSISEFVERYDLYDRGIEDIIEENNGMRFVFSMFHCDDPERDDEKKEYLLNATFNQSDVSVVTGELRQNFKNTDGEILDFSFNKDVLKIGISWRDYSTKQTSWCEIEIRGDATDVREHILEIV